jgi:ribosomal protein S27AE
MQSTTVFVNSHNDACPKCGAGISGDTKTCGSCGSVRLFLGVLLEAYTDQSDAVLSRLSYEMQHCIAWDGVVGEAE